MAEAFISGASKLPDVAENPAKKVPVMMRFDPGVLTREAYQSCTKSYLQSVQRLAVNPFPLDSSFQQRQNTPSA